MIISVNWLKEYVDIDMPINELATLIGARLVEIEEVIDYGARYKDVVVAKVVSCESLEGSDHLNVTKLDDGGVVKGVERDENGHVQVVCGAPNVRANMFVAWLPPKTVVPETYGTDEPFVLDARKLRGVTSNGMIASARELALYDEHEGILEIGMEPAPGTSFAELLALDDTLLDIENKSLTHRPDTFGVIGFAREVAGIQGKQFKTPDWLLDTEPAYSNIAGDFETPKVTIDDPELSSRYQGVVVTNVDGSMKTPLLLQTFLARMGMRPISAIVDTTNYLMLETGQPLHAFDYDKLAAVNDGKIDIHVRAGRKDETLELLDGRTIALSPEDIVIANGETAVALAGAMGGAATEVDKTTKIIFLESATFNLYNLRATQMRHGIFSEAITRFTKGQPAALTAPVLAKAIALLLDMGASQASQVVEAYPDRQERAAIKVSASDINTVLGTELTSEKIMTTLKNVDFEVTAADDGTLSVVPPYWRADIHIREDIVEEVGRLNGFDMIEPVLPSRDLTAVRPSAFDEFRSRIRQTLTRAGGNEVLTYSFVHGDLLTKAGQDTRESYKITNSISPNLQYYRQSLTPSLLGLVHPNIKQDFESFALFELNKTHQKLFGLNDENVPHEVDRLALILANKHSHREAPYYQAKRLLDYLVRSLSIHVVYLPMETEPNYPETAPFEHRRSALVTDKTGAFLGVVGEYKKSIVRGFKLPDYVAGFEISTSALAKAATVTAEYSPLSRYPGTERDICFRVPTDVQYQEIVDAVQIALDESMLETIITPVDIYQAEGSQGKNVTIRISLTSHTGTLTGDEITPVIESVARSVQTKTGASIV